MKRAIVGKKVGNGVQRFQGVSEPRLRWSRYEGFVNAKFFEEQRREMVAAIRAIAEHPVVRFGSQTAIAAAAGPRSALPPRANIEARSASDVIAVCNELLEKRMLDSCWLNGSKQP